MSMLFRIKSACSKKNGITLTELLVASVMIAIVMIGVASFSLAIKNLHQSTSKSVLVALRSNSIMARIVKDASLAVGHESDRGVLDFNGGGGTSICFRHDLPETPDDYTDDSWICYFQASNPTAPLESCGIVPPARVPVQNNGDCNAGSLRQALLDLESGGPIFASVVENSGSRFMYIDITLVSLFDVSPTNPFDPINNPRYTANTQISPIGHSR